MQPRSSIILSVDAGSSSIRCTSYALLDSCSGRPEEVPLSSQSPIKAIQGMNHSVQMMSVSPNTGYIRIHEVLDAIDLCIDEVLRLLRQTITDESYTITALGFSTFVMNLVGVDEFGQPLGDEATMSYACNRADVLRTCSRIERTMSADSKQALYQQTGAPLHPAYALPQLLTFYDTKDCSNSHLVDKVHKWKSISSICLSRWTGHSQPISFSEASWTGLLNYTSCRWNDEAMKMLEKSCNLNVLPPLSDFDIGGHLTKGMSPHSCDGNINSYWNRWPELRQCRFCLGIGDGAAANIGSKCGCGSHSLCDNSKRRIAVTIGTSAAARLCLPLEIDTSNHSDIVVPFGLFCYRVDKSTILLGGALTDGGSVIEWARSLFNLQSTESFTECLEKVSTIYDDRCNSSSSGVSMVPFLGGERSTGFRVGANGCISGITRETTSIDIVYACLESVVLRLCAIIKLLTGICSDGEHILVASGNALERNQLWRQMLADCCGIQLVVDSDSNEGTSRGVALLVAKTLCNDCIFEEPLVVLHDTSVPDLNAADNWNNASLAQESLIESVSSAWGGNKT